LSAETGCDNHFRGFAAQRVAGDFVDELLPLQGNQFEVDGRPDDGGAGIETATTARLLTMVCGWRTHFN